MGNRARFLGGDVRGNVPYGQGAFTALLERCEIPARSKDQTADS